MKKSAKYTLNYTLINMSYFACYCGIHAYAAVFLLGRGFSNTAIGILLAVSNILSVLLQPVAAGYIDKYKQFTNKKVSIACAAAMVVLCALLYFVQNFYAVFIIYLLTYSLQMIYQPLIMAMSFEYNARGAGINFGLARGLGSCGFALTSAFVGNVVVALGVDSIQIMNVVMLLIGILMLGIFVLPAGDYVNQDKGKDGDGYVNQKEDEGLVNVADGEEDKNYVNHSGHNSLISFIKYYPYFSLFVLAGTCMFFGHNALNDYLIQIITPLGGNEAIMGYMVMMAASLELPTMSFFTRLEKKFGCRNLLILSGIMFTVKTLIMLLAPNIFVAFISQACQIAAYAMFIPGSAYFAEMCMEQADKTKGQAYVNVSITLGGVFSSLICGRLLDVFSVHIMLTVALVVSAIGALLAIFALRRDK